MSLVEMLIAMVILALTLGALASTTITSLAAVNRNERQVRATALANEVVEHMKGTPWQQTGFLNSDFGGSPPPGTVIVDGPRASGPPCESMIPPMPSCNGVMRDGIAYDIASGILWVDAPATATDTQDYKRLITTVSWTDPTGTRQVRSESLRAPTPAEKNPEILVVDVSVSPDPVAIDAAGQTSGPLTVTATTNLPADSVALTYDTRSGPAGPYNNTVPANAERTLWSWTVNSGTAFANGRSEFFVEATAPNQVPAPTSTDGVVFLQPLNIVSASPSPDPIRVFSGTRALKCNPTAIMANVDGLTGFADHSVEVVRTDTGYTATANHVQDTVSGATFKVILPDTQTFLQDTTTFRVTAERDLEDAAFDASDGPEDFTFNVQAGGSC